MRGGDTTGLRAYNERLMITAIRQAGALSKAEIARTTGLSGQAATVIVNSLLDEGLLVKRDKVRGRVGKPFTPIALNPEGAYSIGIKIGRRSLEVLLVDFDGAIVASRSTSLSRPASGADDGAGDGYRGGAHGLAQPPLAGSNRRARRRHALGPA